MKIRELKKISDLNVGDIVRNKDTANVYLVADVKEGRATVIRTFEIYDAEEWSVVEFRERLRQMV